MPAPGRSRFGLWVALGAAAAVLSVVGCLSGLVLLRSGASTTTGPQLPTAPAVSGTGSPSSSALPPVAPAAPSTAATSPTAPVRAPTTPARATAPTRSTAPALSLCGAPFNPYGFNFCGRGHLIYPSQLPDGVCSYFACIDNFFNGSGYMVECTDGRYSMSGGKQGACSYHKGVWRAVSSG